MVNKFWEAEEVEGKYMEVIISAKDGTEYLYWVNLVSSPKDEDEYDWSIDVAINYHNNKGFEKLSKDDAEACEPFSRDKSEFTFIT